MGGGEMGEEKAATDIPRESYFFFLLFLCVGNRMLFSSHPEVLEHADLLRELVQVVAVQVKNLTK